MARKRKTVIVGDAKYVNRLDLICIKHYGYYNDNLIDLIVELNPHIDWFEGFTVGDTLTLPHDMEMYHRV